MRSRKVPRPSCSAAARSRIVPEAIVATAGAIVRRAASVRASVKKVLPSWVRRKKYERATPSLHAPPQELPLLGHQRAEDRLQVRAPSAALRLRARQDRAEPHFRSVVEEAALTRAGDQARPLPGT